MKLIKGWSRDLPVRLLVEIAQRHAVSEQEIQLLGHFQSHRLLQLERQQVGDGAVRLNFSGTLVDSGLSVDWGLTWGCDFFLRHREPPFFCKQSWLRLL